MQELNHPYSIPSPLDEVQFNWAKERNLKFFIKRDDLIHSAVSGNKWRKLKYNILQAQHLKKDGIITFGGAYSNHILATAHACKSLGLKSIAFIRGEELNSSSNSILKQCSDWGMELIFISREEYRMKDDWDYLNELKSEYSSYFIVSEGGKNFFGIVGCQEIIKEIEQPFNDIWTAIGTATTSIGLAMSVQEHQIVHAVPVLAGFDSRAEIEKILKSQGLGEETNEDVFSTMEFHPDFSFGGYGKTTPELIEFIQEIKESINLELDPVYTAKAFFAMVHHYQNNNDSNKSIVFLHTGGLIAGQGLLNQ
jgi:1-aminocyclopropane-1-carboxylate deaminase|tara:strand:- start:36194 stop:37120 length:927 start_codon:yes stop_codon:yes gene_type:complete